MKPFNIRCIFHVEVHPSLRIWPNGCFYCHGCGEKGDVNNNYHLNAIFQARIANYIEQKGQLRLL